MTRTKFIGTIVPANIPKARIGIILLKAFPKKATDVVDDVIKIALRDLLKVRAILFSRVLTILLLSVPLYCQASNTTNKSSAPIPSIIKIMITWKVPKYFTWKMKSVIKAVNGKLRIMIVIPTLAIKKDLRWKFKYRNTNIIENTDFIASINRMSLITNSMSFINCESICVLNPTFLGSSSSFMKFYISFIKAILTSF